MNKRDKIRRIGFVLLKTVGFYAGWAIGIAATSSAFGITHPPTWRLLAEAGPLAAIVLVTYLFWQLIEKRRLDLPFSRNWPRDALIGTAVGAAWVGGVVALLAVFGWFTVAGRNAVSYAPVWLLALLLNTIMQEMLVRGYIFSLIEREYNPIAASVATSVLFTLFHAGAFEAGAVAVTNVFTMSLFMSALRIRFGGLLIPVLAHFIWNGAGGILMNGVQLASDYPSMFDIALMGPTLFSGGLYKLEGGLFVALLNAAGILLFTLTLTRNAGSAQTRKS
ncbi:MAG: CPBP family intramembrane metalloprotease [Oscillospiraceae bacterium]|nr:CPBP family intramembrane metalloprotease [Oscillospiraceae bacterium]